MMRAKILSESSDTQMLAGNYKLKLFRGLFREGGVAYGIGDPTRSHHITMKSVFL